MRAPSPSRAARASIRCALFVLSASFLFPPRPAAAQPLADRVPADAMIYLGWSGSDSMGPAYNGSHLKGVMDHSNLPQLFTEALPALMRQLAQADPKAAAPMQVLSTIGPVLWKHPAALYFGGVDLAGGNGPVPKFAVVVDAGADAAALQGQLQQLLARVPAAVPVQCTNYNGRVCLSIGRTGDFDALLGGQAVVPAAAALNTRKEFKDDFAAMVKEPVVAAFVDVEGLLALANMAAGLVPDQRAQQQWATVRDAMGLGGIKRAAFAGGFDGKDWATQGFIATSGPRTGFASMLDAKPLDDDALRAIPQSATFAAAGRFSLGGFMNQMRDMFSKMDPRAGAQWDQGMAQASARLGMDVQKDLLDPIGDQWAVYCAAGVGGNGVLGLTVVNRLADAPKADKSLSALETIVNQQIAQQGKIKSTFQTINADGVAIHSLSVPVVAPSWAVKDGNWYAALYPQVVASAAAQGGRGNKSILDNEDFVALRKRLAGPGGARPSTIEFFDLPRTAADSYPLLLALVQLMQGAGAMNGVQTPAMLLPPLDQFSRHLAPAGSITWTDEAGWHMKSLSPFPGSTLVASQQALLLGQAPLLVSIALPALGRARSQAEAVKSASNLRQIGMACIMHANENHGKYPANLGDLLKQDLTLDVFVSPAGGKAVPADLRAADPAKQAAWLEENADYVYVGADKTMSSPADRVVAYDKTESNGGLNLLFADGHVEFMPSAAAQQAIAAERERQAKPK